MGGSNSEGNTAAGARKTYCSPDRDPLQTCMLGLSAGLLGKCVSRPAGALQ